MALALDVSWGAVRGALEGYRGVVRRFETRGERAGVTYIDDYAHNPEKVAAAIATARDGGWGRVVAVFQPHRYSRTEALWREFGPALGGPDVLFVTDVYAAGEQPRPGVTGRLIFDSVATAHPDLDLRYAATLEEAAAGLRQELGPGDLCLTLGAGDITRLPDLLLGPPGTADG
jgi:UDP-N-acetylmuramate--alanine ligase